VVEVLSPDDALNLALTTTMQRGDVSTWRQLLSEHVGLASVRIRDSRGSERTLLHVVTYRPGYFPGGPEITQVLLNAGADPNAAIVGGSALARRRTGSPRPTE